MAVVTEARVPTADLVDEHGLDVQSCDTQFRSFGRHRAFQGTVVTVRCFEDNALLSAVADEPGDGRVIVVDAGGSLHAAVLGDQMAARAVASGWTGIIINGAVRDVAVLDTLRIGIKALGTNPRRSAKTGAGERDAIVTFGGAVFTPGWWLVSDEDGVVVLAPDLVAR